MNPRAWSTEHQLALVVAAMMGALAGIALGFFSEWPRRTLIMWLSGHFDRDGIIPGSVVWAMMGAAVFSGAIYIRQLLRSEAKPHPIAITQRLDPGPTAKRIFNETNLLRVWAAATVVVLGWQGWDAYSRCSFNWGCSNPFDQFDDQTAKAQQDGAVSQTKEEISVDEVYGAQRGAAARATQTTPAPDTMNFEDAVAGETASPMNDGKQPATPALQGELSDEEVFGPNATHK